MNRKHSLTFIVFLAYLSLSSAATDAVLCYYESWAEGDYSPDDIDVNICTHINYSFFGINGDGTLRSDNNDGLLRRLAALKSKNSNLKLLISVGGWGEDPTGFSRVAADPALLENMGNSAVSYLQEFGFDGIDIDWEYPGERGGTAADQQNFINMLQALRNKFDQSGDYLLTTAVCSDPDCGRYDVGAISQIVDYINVMTYDFHGEGEGQTGENSPLYGSSSESEYDRTHTNCDASINNWLNRGASPQKLVLGLGFYGLGYTLNDPNNHGVGAPASGGGEYGAYSRICTLDWTEGWDDEQQVPYKYQGNQWIGYDNPQSIALKVQYAKSRNLGGVMMWAVDQDDVDGNCGPRNGLLQTIKDNL